MNLGQKTIDRFAEEYYFLKQSGADLHNAYNKLFSAVYEYVTRRKKFTKDKQGFYENDYDMLSADEFIKLFKRCTEKWAPGNAPFSNYFISKFNQRVLNSLKIYNREHNNRQETFIADDDDTVHDILDTIEDKSVEASYKEAELTNRVFSVLCNGVMSKKKEYENSPRICYPVYFFTEFVTRSIHEAVDLSAFGMLDNRYLKVMDHDFAGFYLDGKHDTLIDIRRSRLKALSEFTGDPNDEKACGYQLNNVVYINFISPLKKRNTISDSSISQQRTKFDEMAKLILNEKDDRE